MSNSQAKDSYDLVILMTTISNNVRYTAQHFDPFCRATFFEQCLGIFPLNQWYFRSVVDPVSGQPDCPLTATWLPVDSNLVAHWQQHYPKMPRVSSAYEPHRLSKAPAPVYSRDPDPPQHHIQYHITAIKQTMQTYFWIKCDSSTIHKSLHTVLLPWVYYDLIVMVFQSWH